MYCSRLFFRGENRMSKLAVLPRRSTHLFSCDKTHTILIPDGIDLASVWEGCDNFYSSYDLFTPLARYSVWGGVTKFETRIVDLLHSENEHTIDDALSLRSDKKFLSLKQAAAVTFRTLVAQGVGEDGPLSCGPLGNLLLMEPQDIYLEWNRPQRRWDAHSREKPSTLVYKAAARLVCLR
jgi:hypothetical protein